MAERLSTAAAVEEEKSLQELKNVLNFSFPKSKRLRTRRDFLRLRHTRRRFTGRYIIVDSMASSHLTPRLGITVTKKFGKAHERNRFKRVVREGFRQMREGVIQNVDIHARPSREAKNATSKHVQDELKRFFGA